jgi:hypothetical protein
VVIISEGRLPPCSAKKATNLATKIWKRAPRAETIADARTGVGLSIFVETPPRAAR